MNAMILREFELNSCVTLGDELNRQPWLTPDERMELIVNSIGSRCTELAREETWTNEEYETAVEDARAEGLHEGRADAANEVDRILDGFDIESPDYAQQCVDAINAWLKENA